MPRKNRQAKNQPGQHGGHRDLHRAREKEALVLRLRSEGWTFEEIAAHVPTARDGAFWDKNRSRLYVNRDGASRAYKRALDRITVSDAREAFERDMYRLEEVLKAHLPKAIAGNESSARVVLRGVRDRARILGHTSAASGQIPQQIVDLVDSIRELREDT